MGIPAGKGSAVNWYDDRRGYTIEHAGPDQEPGDFDLFLMGVGDILGGTINPSASRGVQQYDLGLKGQIGHPTVGVDKRSEFEWSRDTLGHKQFTPLDNLAFYGWQRFRQDTRKDVSNLRWPLHALGDATVPHHVAGTAAWGHHPYEDAVTKLWPRIRYFDDTDPQKNVLPITVGKRRPIDQFEQTRKILQVGFKVRQQVKQWQNGPGLRGDIPVQDLVTSLAEETWKVVTTDRMFGPWLWCDECETQYMFGPSIGVYTDSYTPLLAAPRLATRRLQLPISKAAAPLKCCSLTVHG